jgi:gamma-glutamyltranspeptidase/glutathione hydrolase
MLGMLEQDPLQDLAVGSSRYVHLLVETMRRAFADRSEWYGDPDFVQVPLASLLRPDYLQDRRMSIDGTKATASQTIKPAQDLPSEKNETTHFTIMDHSGFVVSNTYTLNGSFGAGAIAEGTGILLNNEMDDFAAKPGTPNMFGLIQGARNKIAPHKRPLSSMTPTIFIKDGHPVLALGSPGGPTIINTVLQVSLNVLVHGYDVQAAVDEPRFHHQWLPDEITWEPRGLNADSRQKLESMGHRFTPEGRFMGDAQVIEFVPQTRLYRGGTDSRLGGKAVAP